MDHQPYPQKKRQDARYEQRAVEKQRGPHPYRPHPQDLIQMHCEFDVTPVEEKDQVRRAESRQDCTNDQGMPRDKADKLDRLRDPVRALVFCQIGILLAVNSEIRFCFLSFDGVAHIIEYEWIKISFIKRTLTRFFEQNKALVGDAAYSLFHGGLVKQPRELSTYRKYYEEDSTVGVSIDTLSEMVAGNGIYATVKDEKSQEALDIVNEFNARVRLDESLLNIDKCLNIYGYCPVERVTRRGPPGGILQLLILDPPSVE